MAQPAAKQRDIELSEAAVKVLSPIAALTSNVYVDRALKHFKDLKNFRKGKRKNCPCCGTGFEGPSRPRLSNENLIVIESDEVRRHTGRFGVRDKEEAAKRPGRFRVTDEAREIAAFFDKESGRNRLLLGKNAAISQARTAQRLLNEGHSRHKLEALIEWCMSQQWSKDRCQTLKNCENLLVQFERDTQWTEGKRKQQILQERQAMAMLKDRWEEQARVKKVEEMYLTRRGILAIARLGLDVDGKGRDLPWVAPIVGMDFTRVNLQHSKYMVDTIPELVTTINSIENPLTVRAGTGSVVPSQARLQEMKKRHTILLDAGYQFDLTNTAMT